MATPEDFKKRIPNLCAFAPCVLASTGFYCANRYLNLSVLLWLAGALEPASAEPIPAIQLQQVFPSLRLHLADGMEEAPDGSNRFFILEQDGRIVVVTQGTDGSAAKEFLNITNRQPHLEVEDGLLGLAFHPRFKTNGLFYIYYTQETPRRVISELKLSTSDSADVESERIVMEVPQPFRDHKAGQMKFGRDGMLYIGLGDGGHGNDPFNSAQNTASVLGKILRIDVDRRMTVANAGVTTHLGYAIPSDNPFTGEPELYEYGVRIEIWAYGLRKHWRFCWDRETGDLWAADVGQDKWKEIDLIVKGGNYGAGQNAITITVYAPSNSSMLAPETATLTLLADPNYNIGTPSSVNLTIQPSAPPAPQSAPAPTRIAVQKSVSGGITITWPSTPGRACSLTAATDLRAPLWINVSPVIVATDTMTSWTDSAAASLPQRFYRVTSAD
jgi:hypothetical protein